MKLLHRKKTQSKLQMTNVNVGKYEPLKSVLQETLIIFRNVKTEQQ